MLEAHLLGTIPCYQAELLMPLRQFQPGRSLEAHHDTGPGKAGPRLVYLIP